MEEIAITKETFDARDIAKRLGYSELNPMQEKAISEGLLEKEKVLVCAPTASGKTLLALLKIIKTFQEEKGKSAYVVPLKALAQEKYRDFSEILAQFGMKVAIATSDFDASGEELLSADVSILTVEKLDSLLRHDDEFGKKLKLVAIDEAHLLNDEGRGGTLEIVMTKLLGYGSKMLALSATISNAEEVAAWLNAKLIRSDYRPTKLVFEVCSGGKIRKVLKETGRIEKPRKMETKNSLEELVSGALKKNPVVNFAEEKEERENGNDEKKTEGEGKTVVTETEREEAKETEGEGKTEGKKEKTATTFNGKLAMGTGQVLVFVSSRRNAEKVAEELSALTKKFSSGNEAKLEELARRVLKALPTPTMQCKKLAECVRNGIAFHHAGLHPKQRVVIEDGFKKERIIKAISCTTTLAMGIDYPASTVIIKDLKRFTGAFSEFIPNFEVMQMCGRAGRPRYDKEGTAILMCSENDSDYVIDNYIFGRLEKIYSKLSSAAVLRKHSLGLIASSHCDSFEKLYGFFGRSFFAHQYKSTEELFGILEDVVTELKEMEFVKEKGMSLFATPVGKRVSELYIDPLSANFFIEFSKADEKKSDLDRMFAINVATEMMPLVSVGKGEEMQLFQEAETIGLHPLLEADMGNRNFIGRYKSAKLLNAWANESTEEQILETFEIPPGIIAARVRNAVWLAYSASELAFMLNLTEEYRAFKRLRRRIRHGIKEELLSLCRIKGIGRVRARKLFDAGIKTEEEFQKKSKEEIRQIIKVKLPENGDLNG